MRNGPPIHYGSPDEEFVDDERDEDDEPGEILLGGDDDPGLVCERNWSPN
jgi:hypothetical protein